MSFVSTLAAFGMTPLCLWIFYETRYTSGTDVEVPYASIVGILLIVIVGVGSGLAVRRFREEIAERVGKIAAGISVVFIVAAFALGLKRDPHVLESHFRIWVFCLLVQPLGYAGGLLFSMLAQQEWRDAMTISLETGVQNFALALAITALSVDEDSIAWKDASRIPILLTALYPVHSAWMVVILRQFPPEPRPEPGGGEDGVTSGAEDGLDLEAIPEEAPHAGSIA